MYYLNGMSYERWEPSRLFHSLFRGGYFARLVLPVTIWVRE